MTLAPAAPAAPADDETRRRPVWKPLAAAGLGGAVLLATGYGVFATLEATANNTTPQNVSTGTLSLILEKNGIGFDQAITNVAPLDTVNRYVTLTNNGTLEAKGLTMQLTATGSQALISDGVASATSKALTVSVSSCSVAWDATAGTCAGTSNLIINKAVASSLTGAAKTLSTAGQIAGGATHLQIALALPDQTENIVNGVQPLPDALGTIQNQTAKLTWTFKQVQRDGLTTNS